MQALKALMSASYERLVVAELALHNVSFSASEMSPLGRKIITYLARAHRQAVPRIREAMTCDGGYVLHLDAMHAGDAPALMTGMDGLSNIVRLGLPKDVRMPHWWHHWCILAVSISKI